VGDRWFVDETYVKVNGVWGYVYRAVDQYGQVIDVLVSKRKNIASARQFFTTALAGHRSPREVITDRAPALANAIEELNPAACHNTGHYENHKCEADHGRLKARLRPMRGLKTERTASVVIRGHAFVQTYDAATTSWESRPCRCSVWPPDSTNCSSPSDRRSRHFRLLHTP
jgi:transposase-like protein